MTAPVKPPLTAPIGIIGMACIFPGAGDLQTFWNNILNGVDAIGEPTESWGAQRYLDDGRIKTKFGGFLKDLYRFDPREFGIMPNSIDGSEPDQFLALRVARDAQREELIGFTAIDGIGHDAEFTRIEAIQILQKTAELGLDPAIVEIALRPPGLRG